MKISYELLGDDISCCKELCNELMAFQRSKATICKEAFDGMNFETRMKKSYETSLRKQVVVAMCDGEPVGYVFSTIDEVTNTTPTFPDWAPKKEGGFYPEWLETPAKIGCLNNLYLRDGYKGMGIGGKLFDIALQWLESFDDVGISFIYISNGNDDAMNFYLSRKFTYSHDVFGGFIKAVCKKR